LSFNYSSFSTHSFLSFSFSFGFVEMEHLQSFSWFCEMTLYFLFLCGWLFIFLNFYFYGDCVCDKLTNRYCSRLG
jgi:hypothetical protein